MIHVHVRILGALSKPQGRDELEVPMPERSRVTDLLTALGYRPEHLRFILTAVNGTQRKHGHELEDRDEVTLVLPTSGG